MNIILKWSLLILFSSSLFANNIVIAYSSTSGEVAPNQIIEIKKLQNIAIDKNLNIEIKGLPWKRALLMLEKGKLDGLINASYKTNRTKFAVYPTNEKGLDNSKRLNDGSSYYIYKHKDSPLVWDGKSFIGSKNTVAVMANYAVLEDLKKHENIVIKEFDNNVEIIRRLASKKITAYAGISSIADKLLKEYSSLSENIVRESLPIRKKDYYLIFSKKSYEKKSQEIEKIWQGLKEYNEKYN